jgi:hypothetical protein
MRIAAIPLLVLALLAPVSHARAEAAGDYAPGNIEHTVKQMRLLCIIPAFCPIGEATRGVIDKALANDPSAQYLLGLTLLTGDGLPGDRTAGVAWIVLAAEQGYPAAARDIAARVRNGASIAIDETKVANALKPQADAGDLEAMRALGPMYIGGRGVEQNPAHGLDLLRQAAAAGSSDAESNLSQIYLNGAPGVPANRPEALRWLTASARHDNVEAMLTLGYMSMTTPMGGSSANRDLATGFCWLMRAALLDQVQAQEKLSMVFAQGDKDEAGTVIPIDLIQADLWFRLAARNPYHDNSQIRAMIEPHMTTAQLDQAKHLFETWRPVTIAELKSAAIPLPRAAPNGGPSHDCPPLP